MGWNLLRRKTLTAIAAALVLAGVPGSAGASAAPGGIAAAPGGIAAAPGGIPAEAPAAAAPQDADGPLPPAQGHLGVELYSLSIPDEDVIGRFVDGLLLTRRDWLQAVLDRSLVYREVIVRAIGDRMLPRELRFLPAVESGYQARALSPRGAAGLWQLMRNTASPYGLRMDQWVDERRDFWKATDASLSKLTENFAIFGDWYLALAAYNCGVGKLSAIRRKNPGCDYWALRRRGVLPRETAAFVPQFLALARILGYPGRYGLEIGWDASPEWTRIPVDRCVDLRILSRESGVPLDALTAGNQELNFPMTPPASYGYQLKVRAEHSGVVEKTLAGATLPLLEFRVHIVAEGDTLSAMARHYGVSVALIQEFNPKLAPRALRIGSKVLVPITPVRSSG
jgi:membrane-bound lytic murein transglycosylase D